jgi:hypothetical protein
MTSMNATEIEMNFFINKTMLFVLRNKAQRVAIVLKHLNVISLSSKQRQINSTKIVFTSKTNIILIL